MFVTPRVNRRLVFTPRSSVRRVRRARPNATNGFRKQNRFTPKGVRRTGSLRSQVKALQTYVNKLKPETKYVSIDLANSNIPDASGGIVHLTAIAQGDTQITRDGNVVNITSLNMYMQFTRQDFTTDMLVNAGIRFFVVVDKEQIADTQPSVATIFTNTAPVDPLPALNNLERFRLIYMSPYIDGMQLMLQTTGSNNLSAQKSNVFQFVKDLNIKVAYNGTASTDIEKNGIYFGVMLQGFNDQFDMTGTARLGFTDS